MTDTNVVSPVIQVGDVFNFFPAKSKNSLRRIEIVEMDEYDFKVRECLMDGSHVIYGKLNKDHMQEMWKTMDIRKPRVRFVSGSQIAEYSNVEAIVEVLY